MGSKGPKLSLSGQRRLWSDWADAQADLSLRWAHMPFCWFCHEEAQICLDVMEYVIVAVKLNFKRHQKTVCKNVKMAQNCFKFVDPAQQKFLTEMGYCRYISTANFPSRSLGKNTTGQYYCERDLGIGFTFNDISRSGLSHSMPSKLINLMQVKLD